jgi:hypothetical protein
MASPGLTILVHRAPVLFGTMGDSVHFFCYSCTGPPYTCKHALCDYVLLLTSSRIPNSAMRCGMQICGWVPETQSYRNAVAGGRSGACVA